MPLIGNLNSSAATTFQLSYLPQFLQVDSPSSTNNFDGLTVQAKGAVIMQLTSGAQIIALMKIDNQLLGAGASTALARRLMLALGRVEASSTITVGNADATTPPVYENSLGVNKAGIARKVTTSAVVASSNNTFEDFDVIFMLPANLARVNVTYENGWSEDLTAAELQALYAVQYSPEASGLVNGFVVIAGTRGQNGLKVVRAIVYSTGGGNCDVVVCNWQSI